MSDAWSRAEKIIRGDSVASHRRRFEGKLVVAGHNNAMGVFLCDDEGEFTPFDIPNDWHGMRVRVTVELLND